MDSRRQNLEQPSPEEATGTWWLFWNATCTGLMAAHLSSSLVQTCGRQFWYKIYWKWSWTSPAALQKHFEIEEDWEGALYCGIWLKWNYSKRCTDMKMPGHVIFSLESFKLSKSTKKQDCTKEPYPQKYGRLHNLNLSIPSTITHFSDHLTSTRSNT